MIPFPRKFVPLLALASLVVILFFSHSLNFRDTWRDLPQSVGLGEVITPSTKITHDDTPKESSANSKSPQPAFHPGTPKSAGNYSRILVVPRMSSEDTTWIKEELPDLDTAIYVADDPSAPLHPPKNKGHEVMIYLTYIIDHYEELPDIMIFMHAHRYSWHNNDILNNDAVEMISRLSSQRVTREGYMNMRCHWDPGCPDWMHPGRTQEDINKQEETMLAKAWSELFPLDPIPTVLAQPCCAQFALSRERIQTVPKGRYIYYRDWLLRTPLSDYISGRVWEYIWQYVFTGESTHCPVMHMCYCDGFGVCFENEDQFKSWFQLRFNLRQTEGELLEWQAKARRLEEAKEMGRLDEASLFEVPETGKDVVLAGRVATMKEELYKQKDMALERGNDPRNRAEACGREWKEGDGF
ncbi:MAG: hypothetical protein M1834_001684 [Cirrosporium novae-zelandiae]|nr:MAG: hypothetical protein M1834_001684 [Cirrosporium novae-zelandiae]